MNHRLTCIAIFLLLVFCGARLYGQAMYALCGGDIPASWNARLYSLPHKNLVQQFGRPDADLAGKGYQHWQKAAWWGFYELQVGYIDCCTDQALPYSVHIAAFVKGKYDPVLYQKINRPGITPDSPMEKAAAQSRPE